MFGIANDKMRKMGLTIFILIQEQFLLQLAVDPNVAHC